MKTKTNYKYLQKELKTFLTLNRKNTFTKQSRVDFEMKYE